MGECISKYCNEEGKCTETYNFWNYLSNLNTNENDQNEGDYLDYKVNLNGEEKETDIKKKSKHNGAISIVSLLVVFLCMGLCVKECTRGPTEEEQEVIEQTQREEK